MKNVSTMMSFALMTLATVAGAQDEEAIEKQVASLFRAAASQSAGLMAEAEKTAALGSVAVPHLMEGLEARSENEIVWGIRCLKVLKSSQSGDQIKGFCSSDSSAVRVEAVIALEELHPDDAPAIARRLMKDPEVQVRRRAIDVLLHLTPEDEATIRIATEALAESDFWICGRAVRLLSRIEYKTDKERLALVQESMALLPKLGSETASLVINLVAGKAGEQSLPFLVAAARRNDSSVKAAAYGAAGRLKLDALIESARLEVRDRDLKLRLAVIQYLALLRDRGCMSRLVDILEDENDPSREQAAIALRRISGRTYGYDVARWREYIAKD